MKMALLQKYNELFRFVLVGASVALIYVIMCTFALHRFVQFPKPLVTFVCYCILILPTYLLHHGFSFKSGASHKKALPSYIIVQIIGMILNYIFSHIAFNWFHLPNLMGSAIITALTSITSFIILKLWTFANPEKE